MDRCSKLSGGGLLLQRRRSGLRGTRKLWRMKYILISECKIIILTLSNFVFYHHNRSLNHPNILSLLGTVEKPFSIMLITNYVNGTSLHSLIFDKDDQVGNKFLVEMGIS